MWAICSRSVPMSRAAWQRLTSLPLQANVLDRFAAGWCTTAGNCPSNSLLLLRLKLKCERRSRLDDLVCPFRAAKGGGDSGLFNRPAYDQLCYCSPHIVCNCSQVVYEILVASPLFALKHRVLGPSVAWAKNKVARQLSC